MAPIQNPTGSSTNQSAADFEPDEQWKSQLKVDIESNLRSMVDEAKQNLHDTLKKAPVSIVERKRLTEEHLTTMKNICNLAEGQFRISLERERQVRRWAAGQVLDQEWSDTMRKEQQAILDNIERNHKDKATHSSQPIADPSISRSNRPPERVWTEHEHEAGYFPRLSSREFEEDHVPPPRNTGKARAGSVSSAVGSYKLPSTLDTTDGGFERPKPSPTIDELDDIPRSAHSATDVQDSIRCGSPCHKASISTGQPPEIWRPSITPEQDAQMSRTFSIARRGSTASATSSYWAPSVLNIPFSYEPHDSAMERERERISAMKQEWSSMDRMRQRERTMSYTYAEARASVTATPQWLDERYAPPSSSVAPIISSAIPHTRPVESSSSTAPIAYTRPAHSQSSTAPIRYTRSSDSSRPHAPPPSASRPIVTNKSFTFDGGDFQASPSSKSWTGPSRSPQAPEEIPQNWWSSNLCAGPSSQDMRYGYNVGETGYYAARPVHTHHEVSEGEHDVDLDDTEGEYDEVSEGEYDEVSEGEYDMDLDDAESQEYDERQMPQREASVSLRSKGVAQPEQESRREKNARREAKLKEELTSDDKQKDGFRKHKDKKKQEKFEWESWNCNPPGTSRPTPPPQMATSQSQSSSSSTGPWPITNRSDHSMPEPSRPTDRSSFGSTSTSRISAAWTSSTRPNLTASSYPPSTPKPPTLSAQQNAKTILGPPPTFFSEAEFHRRQAEQAQQREEQFRREQTKLEQERLSKAVKVKQVKQDASAIELFERHRGQWDKLQMSRMLIWDNFPWPVFKRSSGPDDITTPGIIAYMLSSLHPIDKSPRHRVKENIKRWHHDRFEIWLLPKVKESDRDSVREAASTVARTLYHLLRSGTQDPDVSTASSRIIVLEAPILLAQQNTNVSSHLTYTPIPTTQISTSPSPEATAIVEEASQELPDSVSDSLEDLTNELQGKSSFPAASGGFGDIWKCILVKANENVD
ncbi:uncharacterized protein BJ212DRAFT_499284 [Suillus subaureus]|uniref:Uncharacterized protein n=1 Tax=Suillus subaureus TaxID=48587 RepID=A0A9P7E5N0_9AGAM|nr:uncharacterized protein BJ212DRAFT_499284 [Suillus subaureus]KAG1811896.1 hypothetical protein BJ212DRAFT_499284 [Suillus subaureus]